MQPRLIYEFIVFRADVWAKRMKSWNWAVVEKRNVIMYTSLWKSASSDRGRFYKSKEANVKGQILVEFIITNHPDP